MESKEEPKKEKYPGSVLLCDHITMWVDEDKLIVDDTFDSEQLKRAKYDVRLGKAFYQHGKYGALNDDNPLLEIDPYELVFVESYEIFKLPKNIVGMYDLRVSGCLWGLGLQTGLQLDPEYYGKIFCPLFNFSDLKATLIYKRHLASIQFIYTTTTSLIVEQRKSFDKQRGLLSLKDVIPEIPRRSGLEKLYKEITEIRDKINDEKNDLEQERKKLNTEFEDKKKDIQTTIEKLKEEVEQANKKSENSTMSSYNIMAFMIMALAVIVSTVSIAVTRNTPGANIALAIGAVVIICGIGALIYFQNKKIK